MSFPKIQNPEEERGHGHIVAVVFAAVVVISIAIVAWFYHRRRVADLKCEIAQVQYTSEPIPTPGRFYIISLDPREIFEIFSVGKKTQRRILQVLRGNL